MLRFGPHGESLVDVWGQVADLKRSHGYHLHVHHSACILRTQTKCWAPAGGEAADSAWLRPDYNGGREPRRRGDAPGFVVVEDETTLLLPDRRGNNRIDSLRNIVADPRVALLFLIPGVGETLRVGRPALRLQRRRDGV